MPPFIETELGDHATGKPDEPYVFKSADLAEFDERYENYSVDLDVVSSLMEFADKQSPRYWQLAKALQRSLNAYDERNPESVEAARAALAGVLAKPANASAMNAAPSATRISTPHGCGRCARHAARWPAPYPTHWL